MEFVKTFIYMMYGIAGVLILIGLGLCWLAYVARDNPHVFLLWIGAVAFLVLGIGLALYMLL